MPYVFLGAAIVLEVIATTFLKLSDGFTKPVYSLITIGGYTASFYFLSLCIQQLGVGFTYAVWSAVGIVLIASIGIIVFHEKLDVGGAVGMGLIIAGVIVLNLFSKMSGS